MASLTHYSDLLDHKIVSYFINEEGVEESHLYHMRVIGDGDYTYIAKKCMVDGDVKGEETIETNIKFEEIDLFKEEWNREWHPANLEPERESSSIMCSIFHACLKVFNFFFFT